MAKKRKLNPIQTYVAYCKEWARVCRGTVYGRPGVFNLNLDKEFDYHCVGRSTTVKRKGSYQGSGLYKAYELLAMERKSLREVELLEDDNVQRELEEAAALHGYGTGQLLIAKSVNYDEKAQSLRDEIFRRHL